MTATLLAAAYLAGLWTPRIYGFLRHVYLHLKHGICFRFKGTGRRELRMGTLSEFCQRCGHPHGYHSWD